MSNLKKIFTIGLIAVLVLSLSSCKKDEDNPVTSTESLTGTWVLTSIKVSIATLTPDDADYHVTITLKSDKTFQMSLITGGQTTSSSGTYSTSNGSITFTPTSGSPMVWTYTLSGSTLNAKTTMDLTAYGYSSETPVSLVFNKQ
jgi:hypothetical protein